MTRILNRIKKIEKQLPEALYADRVVIERDLFALKRPPVPSKALKYKLKKLHEVENRLARSISEKSWRIHNRPKLKYNLNLPITAKKDEIITAIGKYPVVIISGETGSGKTTQIPKFCLAAGRGIYGQIGCTQPRRIAATTVANRISEELGEKLGVSVGYKIRFKSRTGPRPFIKIMTDGILLSETQQDPYLSQYDTVIVDEAHERSLNIDFVLGILNSLLKKRADLKVIITSATIDTEKFSKAFGKAPVIEVSGRMYPVETIYSPMTPAKDNREEPSFVDLAVRAIDDLQAQTPFGDILVFMPTEQGIRETCDLIAGKHYRGVKILPLFARLSARDQKSVFKQMPGRKIIVATNVAETSLTIPGIKYVVDTGLARISQYRPRSRTTALPVVPISKSSADQRRGRCGRMENGVCIRLFSEEDYAGRPLFTPPEIQRSNLAEVILRMIALNLGNISDFPFIDRPIQKSIKDGFDLLVELGAIKRKTGQQPLYDEDACILTPNGRLMAKMPLDPRLSRMLIEARKEGVLEELVIIVSALSIQDPRERPAEKSAEADQCQAVFRDPASDFITLLNIWSRYRRVFEREKSLRSIKRFCKKYFLSFNRMREWRDIHTQITSILKEQKFVPIKLKKGSEALTKFKKQKKPNTVSRENFSSRYGAIHRSILSGFLSNIAMKKEKNIFRAARGREVMIFPGSGLFNRAGTWLVAAETVETSRLFIRTVARIDPSWLEPLGKELCKYTYLHPRWERNKGEVVATEQVSLFGLIIVPDRKVGYGTINPEEAFDIFIRAALLGQDVNKPLPFMAHNLNLINQVKDIENRIRRRDLLASEEDLVAFYKQRLPVISGLQALKKIIRERGSDAFLNMNEKDLYRNYPDNRELSLYPDKLALDNRKFLYHYKFEPGAPDDGITVKISADLAADVPSEVMDWMVPGFLVEKISALIKGLPKKYRTRLVPINTVVSIIISEMPYGEEHLATALSKFIAQRFGYTIPAAAWPLDKLADHLKMRIAITDQRGNVLRASRDKTVLQQNIPAAPPHRLLERVRKKWERTHITRWDFGDLPETVIYSNDKGEKQVFYLGLEKGPPGSKSVQIRVFRRKKNAAAVHRKGVSALFSIYLSKELRLLKKQIRLPEKQKKLGDYFGGAERLEGKIITRLKKDFFKKDLRTKKAFEDYAKAVLPRLHEAGQKKLAAVLAVLKAYHEARATLFSLEKESLKNPKASAFLQRLRKELSRLVPDTFIDLYGDDRLILMDRYIRAISIRAQRGLINLEKDQQKAEKLSVYSHRLEKLLKELTPLTSDEKRKSIEEFFWLLEEYKISLFAQELKTALPVSQKRLDRKLLEIEKMI